MSIPDTDWGSYTWKTNFESLNKHVSDLEEELAEKRHYLSLAKQQFESARKLGIENEPLPKDYAERFLTYRRNQ